MCCWLLCSSRSALTTLPRSTITFPYWSPDPSGRTNTCNTTEHTQVTLTSRSWIRQSEDRLRSSNELNYSPPICHQEMLLLLNKDTSAGVSGVESQRKTETERHGTSRKQRLIVSAHRSSWHHLIHRFVSQAESPALRILTVPNTRCWIEQVSSLLKTMCRHVLMSQCERILGHRLFSSLYNSL